MQKAAPMTGTRSSKQW